jgi:Tfp pilus assembly protein PilO
MNIKNRQQFLMVLTGIVVALYLGNLLLFGPMQKLWKSRQATIAQLRQQVSSGRVLIRREDIIRDEWGRMRANALPPEASSAEQQMLRGFDRWAQASGVNIESITPQWENDQEDYSTLDIRVDATGDLMTLTRFLYQIENDSMPIQIESVQFTARDDQGQELSLGLDLSGLALISNSQ